MTATVHFSIPRQRAMDKFNAIDLATADFLALLGANGPKAEIVDRTVIGSHLDDGRATWTVGISWIGLAS